MHFLLGSTTQLLFSTHITSTHIQHHVQLLYRLWFRRNTGASSRDVNFTTRDCIDLYKHALCLLAFVPEWHHIRLFSDGALEQDNLIFVASYGVPQSNAFFYSIRLFWIIYSIIIHLHYLYLYSIFVQCALALVHLVKPPRCYFKRLQQALACSLLDLAIPVAVTILVYPSHSKGAI